MHEGALTGDWDKLGQSVVFNLLQRLRSYRRAIWRSMTDKDIQLTNNLAGQALRKANVKQNIYSCFKTTHGASRFFYDALLPGDDARAACLRSGLSLSTIKS